MKQTILILSLLIFFGAPHILASEVVQRDRLGYAVKLFQEADYNKAIDELKNGSGEALGNNALPAEISYIIGMAHRALANWSESAEWLRKASKYETLADYALFYSGEAYMNAGDFKNALDTFLSINSMFPESRWREDSSFRASESLFQLGRYFESRSSFELSIKEYPRSLLTPQAIIRMAECSEKVGEQIEAYRYYKNLWVTHPSSPESRTALERIKQIETAQTASERPPITISDIERYNRACNLFSGNNYREGINELQPLLKQIEKNDTVKPGWAADALLKLADAYYQVREDEKAIAALSRLFGRYSTSSKIVEESEFLRGKALQRLGQRREAAASFAKLIKDYPSGEFTARAMYREADMAEGDGEHAKASTMYHGLYLRFRKNPLASAALWKEGWLSYLEKDYKGASLIFKKLLNEYPYSEFTDTAAYWSARTAEKLGMGDNAVSGYTDIINRFPLSYYSAISRGRLSVTIPGLHPLRKIDAVSYRPINRHPAPDRYVSLHMDKGRALMGLGFREDASLELSLAETRCADKATLLEIASLLTEIRDYYRAQRAVMKGFREYLKGDLGQPDSDIWTYAFPAAFDESVRTNAQLNSISPFLIHAVMREESSYKPDAVSRAGAIGLMQLMPPTGSKMSREAGLKGYSTPSLYGTEVNISLGSRYLKKLIEEFNGKIPLAIAAYNAGPNAVSGWISEFGTEEMDEFIERIPYPETRNYVKKVLRSYEVYERLYNFNHDPAISKEPALTERLIEPERPDFKEYQ